MTLKNFKVKRTERGDISDFIETHHYSHSINGCISDYCFALYNEVNTMVGAMFYGRMAMHNQWRKFAEVATDVIELRRLVCIDDTPKNTESYFIGATLRMMKNEWNLNGVVVSYADKEYGHSGIIYKASNFKQTAITAGAKVIIFEGKRYHDKAIRTKYKGELKPFAKRLKLALEEGRATYKHTAGKITYIYKLGEHK